MKMTTTSKETTQTVFAKFVTSEDYSQAGTSESCLEGSEPTGEAKPEFSTMEHFLTENVPGKMHRTGRSLWKSKNTIPCQRGRRTSMHFTSI